MAKHATKRQVKAVIAKLAAHFEVSEDTFTAYEPGYHNSGWTIAAEEGTPYQWTYEAGEAVKGITAVWVEPQSHCILSVLAV